MRPVNYLLHTYLYVNFAAFSTSRLLIVFVAEIDISRDMQLDQMKMDRVYGSFYNERDKYTGNLDWNDKLAPHTDV